MVIAEGWQPGTQAVAEYLSAHRADLGFEVRVTVLGYVQRGGRPSAFDRLLATRMGAFAADRILEGDSGNMVALRGNKLQSYPLADGVAELRELDLGLLGLVDVMD